MSFSWSRISPLAAIPIIGRSRSNVLSLCALVYAAHLLGYALYRRSRELGWE